VVVAHAQATRAFTMSEGIWTVEICITTPIRLVIQWEKRDSITPASNEIEIAQRERFQSGFSYVVFKPHKNYPDVEWICWLPFPGEQQFFCHRFKRKKHMTLITQCKRFCRNFKNVLLRNANGIFTKNILHARRQETQIAMTVQSGI
jgi:hypothetical protein